MAAIEHREGDRVPLNLWNYRPEDMIPQAIERYGSVEGWYERFQLDMHTTFLARAELVGLELGERLTLSNLDRADLGEIPEAGFEHIKAETEYHHSKDRAVFCQIQGVHEGLAGYLGIENTLLLQAMDPPKFKEWIGKLADMGVEQAKLAAKAGADVIHVSDDWGANKAMMFSPSDWWEYIFPEEKRIVDEIKRQGKPASLHSCGYFTPVLEGVIKMGFDVAHPIQESAGMDPYQVKRDYGDKLCIYGGLDIRYTLPRAPEEELVERVKRAMLELKPGGGFIFCTAHTVQPDTTWERIELAYDTALKWCWY